MYSSLPLDVLSDGFSSKNPIKKHSEMEALSDASLG